MKEIDIIEKYKYNVRNNDICNEYNISRYTLSEILKKHNIEFKQKKYVSDDTFFEEINTEEKAYWLGFLYADGYVRKRKGSELRLKLSTKDLSHLELFKNTIKSTNTIKNIEDKGVHCSYISIYSNKIVDDFN